MQPTWKLASAIVRGRDHVRLDLPCQDAFQVAVVSTEQGPALIAAVSDGAGSARLADVGSRLATEIALAWLSERSSSISDATNPDTLASQLLEAVRVAIAVEAKAHEAPLGDFACTLLVGLVVNKIGFFAQVGDGAIVITHGPEDSTPTPMAFPKVDAAAPIAEAPPHETATSAETPTPATSDASNLGEAAPEPSPEVVEFVAKVIAEAINEGLTPPADSKKVPKTTTVDETATDHAAPEAAALGTDDTTAPPSGDTPAPCVVASNPADKTKPLEPTPTAAAAKPAPPYRCVFWPAKGEHANETVFVTSNSAARHVEANLIRADITDVALFTDGIERLALDFATQTAFPAFFGPFFGAVRSLPAGDAEASAALSAELQAFLDSPRVHDATSDDRALVLASRQGT